MLNFESSMTVSPVAFTPCHLTLFSLLGCDVVLTRFTTPMFLHNWPPHGDGKKGLCDRPLIFTIHTPFEINALNNLCLAFSLIIRKAAYLNHESFQHKILWTTKCTQEVLVKLYYDFFTEYTLMCESIITQLLMIFIQILCTISQSIGYITPSVINKDQCKVWWVPAIIWIGWS